MITKKLCARSLLNLLTDENLKSLNESGAIRIFSSLSTIPSPATQNICARGFLIFTGTDDKRGILFHELTTFFISFYNKLMYL